MERNNSNVRINAALPESTQGHVLRAVDTARFMVTGGVLEFPLCGGGVKGVNSM